MHDNPSSSPNAWTDDAPLLCPHCEYNLAGLGENRCPECGEPFDPAALSALRRQPATPFEESPRIGTFFRTWWIVSTSPRRLAERFPEGYSREWAGLYTFVCYAVAASLFCATVYLAGNYPRERVGWREFKGLALPAVVVGVLSFWICEGAITVLLLGTVRPKGIRSGEYRFWRGLVCYGSGFTIPTAVAGGLLMVALLFLRPSGDERLMIALGGTLACFAFLAWSAWLMLIIVSRSASDSDAGLACVLVPMVGLFMVLVGFVGGCILVFILNPPTFC